MALIRKQNKTLQHPTEPDTTVTVRVPLSAGDLSGMRVDGSQIGMSLDLLAEVIVGWSYPEPVTAETVKLLDLDTFNWIVGEVFAASNIRDEQEKKASDRDSSPTTELVEERSLLGSGIS